MMYRTGTASKKLIENTAFLYLMMFSSQIINVITIPYLTRILGPISYGKISVANSVMIYVQLILDFGFILLATEKVANNTCDKKYINKLFTSIVIIKIVLGIVVLIVLNLAILLIDSLKTEPVLFNLYFFAFFINAFLPDFVYRGMEQMKAITIRTVVIKVLFALSIFVLVKDESDLLKIPLILGVGNFVAVFYSIVDINMKYSIKIIGVKASDILSILAEGIPFFASRMATTFYQALNIIILGIYFPRQAVLGYYGAAEKVVSVSRSSASPIADSIYPYMVKRKDYRLIKIILCFYFPIAVIGAFVIGKNAPYICSFVFGAEYIEAANILRCFLPTIVLILPSYLLCFPCLVPLGLSKYANLSTILGAIVQIILIVLIILFDKINVFMICISSTISEIVVFLFRFIIVVAHRDLINQNH